MSREIINESYKINETKRSNTTWFSNIKMSIRKNRKTLYFKHFRKRSNMFF